jgi:ParB-like chromosome segregation protein Spo0J
MKEMKIEYKNIDDVIPYENNPRKNDEAVDYVANSIKEFGFKVPIIVDKENVIVTGHTRLKAAQKLGLKEVPVIYADDLTEEQVKAFRIADNKVAEFSTWDLEKLDLELEELEDINIDMSDFGILENEDLNIDDEIERKDLSENFEAENSIEVKCKNEEEVEKLYNELIERGYECKIL